jgi:hypothetical protein
VSRATHIIAGVAKHFSLNDVLDDIKKFDESHDDQALRDILSDVKSIVNDISDAAGLDLNALSKKVKDLNNNMDENYKEIENIVLGHCGLKFKKYDCNLLNASIEKHYKNYITRINHQTKRFSN